VVLRPYRGELTLLDGRGGDGGGSPGDGDWGADRDGYGGGSSSGGGGRSGGGGQPGGGGRTDMDDEIPF
jgi:single-strand DNA-binding protein